MADDNYEPIRWDSAYSGAFNIPLGADVYASLAQPKTWIVRRVEHVTFLNENTARRSVSVDFILPSSRSSFSTTKGEVLIPLGLLKKAPLRAFDLRDEDGRPLPVLSRTQNGWVAWSALIALASYVAQQRGVREMIPAAVAEDLLSIATEDSATANAFLGRMWNWSGPSGDYRRIVMEDDGFRDLAEDLAEKFLLLTPVTSQIGARRILKFGYLDDVTTERVTTRMRLAWAPTSVSFDAPAVDEGASYHVEVDSPKYLTIARASLHDESDDSLIADDSSPGDVAHLYASNVRDGAAGKVRVWLHPRLPGLVRSAALFALLTSILLSLLFVRLLEVQKTATSGVLLSVPGLVALFIVRPGEHLLASRLLIVFRAITVGIGLLPFGGALALAMGFEGEALLWTWYTFTILSCMGLLLIGRAVFRISRGMSET